MTDPLFTVPVVGYRRWKMAWIVDAFGNPIVVDSPGFYTIQIGVNSTIGHEAMPALMPHGNLSTGRPWKPGRNDAVCAAKDAVSEFARAHPQHPWVTDRYSEPTRGVKPWHAAPDPNCKCGLYAMHTIDEVLERGALRENEVLGAVVGWGAVEVHADGWRAERAMVVGLSTDSVIYEPYWPTSDSTCKRQQRYREQVRALAKRYGVPAMEMNGLPLIAEGHGQPLPDTAKPKQPTLNWAAGNSMIAGSPGHGHSIVPSYSMAPNVPTATSTGAAFNAYLAEMDEQLAQAKREQRELNVEAKQLAEWRLLPYAIPPRRSFMQRLREHVAWHLHPLTRQFDAVYADIYGGIQRVRDLIPPRRPGWSNLGTLA
jgi:hypothetical protein